MTTISRKKAAALVAAALTLITPAVLNEITKPLGDRLECGCDEGCCGE